MSASTLKSVKPRGRLQPLVTLDRLATAVTWAFWGITIFSVLQVIVALTRSGSLFGPNSQPGSPPRVWVTIAPPLLQHAGGLLIHSGLAAGFARLTLLGLLVTWHVDWVHWPATWGVSWPVECFGLGLIIFARIMRVGAGMRADLEGTV
jgi:uncharacterized membrane protein YphA (DoxX/SURF4 family)